MAPKIKTVGEQVLARMAALGMIQADVCKATGIAHSNLSELVHDRRGLGPTFAIRLGKLLGLDPCLFDMRARRAAERAALPKFADGGPQRPRVASPRSSTGRKAAA